MRLGLGPRAEERDLVGVELRFRARHEPDEAPDRAQEEHAGAAAVGPEDHELPARLQDAMELAEDLTDLLAIEVLEHAEVVDAVEGAGLERQIEYVRLLDAARPRVVPRIETQRPRGDVDGGDVQPPVEVGVHLSAPTSGVEDLGVRGERSLRERSKVEPYHPSIRGGDEVVERPERGALLGPVLVPTLRLAELRAQLVDRARSQEAARSDQVGNEQRREQASAPQRVPDRELGVPVHAGRQHDRNLSDAGAVTTEDEEALEEEPVGAGRHESEELTGNPVQIVEAERTVRIVRHVQQDACQEMPEPRQEQALRTPTGKTVGLEIPGAHDDVDAGGVRGEKAGKVARAVRKVGVQRDEEVVSLVVGVGDADLMRAADPELALSMDHGYPWVLAREPIERLAGAVGRTVVDEQDLGRERQREELRAQPLDVAVLVVGRHEDQAAGRRHGPTPRRRRWWGAGTAAVHPPPGTRPRVRRSQPGSATERPRSSRACALERRPPR